MSTLKRSSNAHALPCFRSDRQTKSSIFDHGFMVLTTYEEAGRPIASYLVHGRHACLYIRSLLNGLNGR